jgi:hypothetical protein
MSLETVSDAYVKLFISTCALFFFAFILRHCQLLWLCSNNQHILGRFWIMVRGREVSSQLLRCYPQSLLGTPIRMDLKYVRAVARACVAQLLVPGKLTSCRMCKGNKSVPQVHNVAFAINLAYSCIQWRSEVTDRYTRIQAKFETHTFTFLPWL